ncbi:YqhG family protein [Paenibacillus sp. y28]|uniref:YqhG family protein n=1 Tax=Paenibacillus sp. y28 TaxID=3129110 RepID=UPI0030183A0E
MKDIEQIERFVMEYLNATGCHIVEKTPEQVTVKLSPEADRELTGRSYYWNFVERTGAEPETMTYQLIFRREPEPEHTSPPPQTASLPNSKPSAAMLPSSGMAAPGDSLINRYFGAAVPAAIQTARIPKEEITYGSRRLEQLFQVVKQKGKYIQLFEQPAGENTSSLAGFIPRRPYCTWLAVNYKVEFMCDLKRDELHSMAINLCTGELVENAHRQLLRRTLTPQLPSGLQLLPKRMNSRESQKRLEQHLLGKLRLADYTWADNAYDRWIEELRRIEAYYEELILNLQEEEKNAAEQQYLSRKEEIAWQFRPRVRVSAINCGYFHLQQSLSANG